MEIRENFRVFDCAVVSSLPRLFVQTARAVFFRSLMPTFPKAVKIT
jgi:hypothetical protein